MNEEELRDYAETIIMEHAMDVDWLSIFEMAEAFTNAGEISQEEAERVLELINSADIVVSWED